MTHSKIRDQSLLDYQAHLTFDIDWTPDVSINEIRKIINPVGIKAPPFLLHTSRIF